MKLFIPSGAHLMAQIASAEAKFDAQRARLMEPQPDGEDCYEFDEVLADMEAQRKGEGLEWWEVQDAENALAENELLMQAQAHSEDC